MPQVIKMNNVDWEGLIEKFSGGIYQSPLHNIIIVHERSYLSNLCMVVICNEATTFLLV